MLTITPLQLCFKFIKEEIIIFNANITINRLKNVQFNTFNELSTNIFKILDVGSFRQKSRIKYKWQKLIFMFYKPTFAKWIENKLKQKDCLEKVITNFQVYNNTNKVKTVSDILDYLLAKHNGIYPMVLVMSVIDYSFHWANTQEGHHFWANINYELCNDFKLLKI